MIPATFEYVVPKTLDEAVALLQEKGDEAKILTGGHSLVPLLKLRLARPSVVIDLKKIEALKGIRVVDGGLEIGASTTHTEIERSADVRRIAPVVAETAGTIGDVQVRNAGTIGGSVVHADPAADWPAALIATGATLVLHTPSGERTVPAEEFFVGVLESAIGENEILTAVRVPAPEKGTGGAYAKLAQSASGFALAGAAAQVTLKNGSIADAHLGITGVGDHAFRPMGVEGALAGCPTDADSVAKACEAVADGIQPLADIHASADYRVHVAKVLTKRAVLAAIEAATA